MMQAIVQAGAAPATQAAALESIRNTAAAFLARYPLTGEVAGALIVLLIAWLALRITRRVVLRIARRFAAHSRTKWDDAFLKRGVMTRLAWVVPIVVIYVGTLFMPVMGLNLRWFIGRMALAALVIVAVGVLSAVLTAIDDIYRRYPMARNRPITGYLQILQIAAVIVGIILAVSILFNQSPWLFVSGLGALTAVFMLVFRDTLLSFVAGIQLTNNDLVRVGDWVEMPGMNANGTVVDIALHTVKVQNFDNTITVIPTHQFLEQSFKNWRGMFESGGRRIERSLNIDMSAIRFLTAEELARLGKIDLLKDYLADKRQQVMQSNATLPADAAPVNRRRLTNIGTFRAYVTAYLHAHPRINQEMTFLVRQLQPGPQGLPLELYVFTDDPSWAVYETIQADIFDHLLAILPEFGLLLFQQPTGHNMSDLAHIVTTARPLCAATNGHGSRAPAESSHAP